MFFFSDKTRLPILGMVKHVAGLAASLSPSARSLVGALLEVQKCSARVMYNCTTSWPRLTPPCFGGEECWLVRLLNHVNFWRGMIWILDAWNLDGAVCRCVGKYLRMSLRYICVGCLVSVSFMSWSTHPTFFCNCEITSCFSPGLIYYLQCTLLITNACHPNPFGSIHRCWFTLHDRAAVKHGRSNRPWLPSAMGYEQSIGHQKRQ